jgi:hypothetical protein
MYVIIYNIQNIIEAEVCSLFIVCFILKFMYLINLQKFISSITFKHKFNIFFFLDSGL